MGWIDPSQGTVNADRQTGVMTMSRPRRAAALLALVAMLLLTLMPGVGRIANSGVHGATVDALAHGGHDDDRDSLPAAHDSVDCSYCLVIGGADLPPSSVALPSRITAPLEPVHEVAAPRVAHRHRNTGSRGPPLARRA